MSSITPAEQQVLELITTEEVTSLAAGLVVASGENPPGEEEATVQVLDQAAQLRGLSTGRDLVAPGRPNLSVELPGGDGPGLLLLGHSDVVPIGSGWTLDPFGGLVRDGRLWGRGSADMKGGLAACLVAMGAIRRAGLPLSGPVELAVTVDEEDVGIGIRRYLESFRAEDYRGCLVAEPTDLQTIIAARGDAYLEIAVFGAGAHSGQPDDGRNAIYGAARIVAAIEQWHRELAAEAHPLAGPASWSVGRISGGTGTSVVPAECRISADRRLLPAERAETVLAGVRADLDRLDLGAVDLRHRVDLVMEMPGFDTPAEHVFVRAADEAARAAGCPARPLAGWSAACDGGFLARGTELPVVVLGPGSVSEQAHRSDESVPVSDLVLAARCYALLAMRLLGEQQ